MRKSSTIVWLIILGFACSWLSAAQVSGRIRAVGRTPRDTVATIVYAESLERRTAPPSRSYTMAQRNKTFTPQVLAVPVGSNVDFPNEDRIFHNVFSLSKPGPFDLGLYRAGASRSHVFSQPGRHLVFCNIHPEMSATVLVLPTAFIAEADSAGHYRFDLPPGRYRITAWSERSQPVETTITVAGATLTLADLTLDESRFVQAPHKNKYGQDYAAKGYEPLKRPKR